MERRISKRAGQRARTWFVTLVLSLSAAWFPSTRRLAQTPNPLVQELKSPNADIRAKAAHELGKSGEVSSVPALAAVLTDPSSKVRREAVIALSQIHSPESLDALINATRDPDPEIRVLAVRALAGYYTGQSPNVGLTGFLKKNYERAKSRYGPDNTQIDPGVAVEPKVISALRTVMMDTRSMQSAREAAKGLGILVARSAVPDLVKATHSSDQELAREALNALSKIKDPSAGPKVIDLLDSPSKEVKQDAAVTAGILRAREAVPTFTGDVRKRS